jgi:DNA-binding NarL/FixJ family response regulator
MEQVFVVVIDDNENYREAFKNFLLRNGITVTGSFTHEEFLEQRKMDAIDIAIIAFDNMQVTQQTVDFLKKSFPSIKILINSIRDNRIVINAVLKMGVQGLIFKTDKDIYQFLIAIEQLRDNKGYFGEM